MSYGTYASSQYIGTTLTVNVTAIQPDVQIPVSVTADVAGSSGSVTLGGLFSTSGIASGTNLYISDGIRTWVVNWVTADGDSITINNAALLGNVAPDAGDAYVPLGWAVSDYSNFANSSFQVYSGTLVTGATTGASVTVDVGQFAQVVLYDNGTNGDVDPGGSPDGIWTGQFKTPNNNTVVTNAYFYASCSVGGTIASNQNFQSSQTASFDMELPAITLYSQSTNNTNYNGDLYLSSLCQGKSAAVPGNIQPSSGQAQFNFTVNKPNTTVNITIGSPTGTYPVATPKQLPPFSIPNGATSLTGWSLWSGDDGNQFFLPDGIYPVYYYVNDTNGLVGVTVTSQIKVVSVRLNISGITITPPLIGTLPAITDGVITNVAYTVSLSNESLSNINTSLQVLGWTDAGNTGPVNNSTSTNPVPPTVYGINSQADPYSTVWTITTQGTLDAQGNYTGFNLGPDPVDDDGYIAEDVFYPYFTFIYGALAPWEEICNYTGPGPISGYNDNFPAGTPLIQGDGNSVDDWRPKGLTALGTINGIPPVPIAEGGNGLFVTSTAGGPNLNPISLSAQKTFSWIGATPAVGNYRIDLQSQLTGLGIVPNIGSAPTLVDPCSPTAAAVFVDDSFHFFPQTQVDQPSGDVYGGAPQGDFLSTQNTSAIFEVQTTANPTGDNTPPEYLSSNPAENSTVQASVYNSSSPLEVQFQDLAASFNTGSAFSYITLTGPNGINVAGESSTNGGNPNGTLTIYFTPSDPLGGSSNAPGGNYSMVANTCNSDGLCVSQTVPFKVQDTTAPALQSNGVVLITQSGTQIPLSVFQNGPQGPFQNIAEISVNIQMPNPTTQNEIDYTDSNVSLYQVSGTTQSPVAMTRLPNTNVTNTQGTLNYSINSVINYAGLFQVQTQTFGQDASGNRYLGPAALSTGTNTPEFTTTLCTVCVNIPFTNNPNINWPAILGEQPVTVTSAGTAVSLASVGAAKPALPLPADPGYAFLTVTAGTGAMQFSVGAVPIATALKWAYPPATPLTFQLYYNLSDLTQTSATQPNAVAPDTLVVLGYNGSSWQTVSGVVMPTSPTSQSLNACTIPVPNNGTSLAYVYYTLAYPSQLSNTAVVAGGTGTPTVAPTAMSFPSTRAFDPWNSNPIYQKARFYYSPVAPATMEARVYDTSGRLIRDLTLGNGITAVDAVDPVYGTTEYYFTWDGTNDSGTVVHNGIYLVRWTETGVDGSHNTQTRPVALIK